MQRDDVDFALDAADAARSAAWLQHLQTAQDALAEMLPRACAQAAAALADRHRHGEGGSRVRGEATQAMARLHPAVAREALRALAPGFDHARIERPPTRARTFDLASLRLLDDGEAQGEVEIALLARHLRDAAGLSVLQLTAREAKLHRDSSRTGDNSPLGAAALAQALWAGCEGLGLTLRAQAEAAREIAVALAEPLDVLYRGLIAAGAKPSRPAAALQGGIPRALPGRERSGTREAPRQATLSDLLQLTRPAEWPADTMPVPADDDDARVPQLIHRHRSELAALPQRDSDWALMELISRLFGLILDDESLPAEVRAWLGPLQARVVQLARRDPELLESHRHPVWVFINKVTSQTVALQAAGDEQAGSFARFLSPLIGELGPEPDGAAFERATQRLRRWQRSQALRQLTEHAPALDHLRLQAEQQPAVESARARLAPLLAASEVPEAAQRFVCEVWALVCAHHGATALATDAMATAESLLWTLNRTRSRNDAPELLRRIPALVADMRAGMSALGYAPAQQDSWLERLAALHRQALLRPPAPPPAAVPVTALQATAETVPPVAAAVSTTEPPTDRIVPPPGDDLDTLETGDSVRLQLHGQWVVAQLLWASDNGQFMLFGSTNGGRSHSFTRRAFERLIAAGLVLPLEDRSALERATDRLSQQVP